MRAAPNRRTLLVAVWAILAVAHAAPAQQDTWSGVERIVAVGDVHGDADQLLRVLRAAEVVNANGRWIAGKTHLVQLGDVLDRAPDSRKAMDLLMDLERQAAAAGGVVHALIGNHEAMVLLDDWRYVHPGEVKAFGCEDDFRKALGPQGHYGKWLRSHNTIIKINDLLFVHGGIPPGCARMTLAQINQAIREQLLKSDRKGLANGHDSPLWDRSLALGNEDDAAEQLDVILKHHGARHLVVGHTVAIEGILVSAGGRLIRADVGLSRYYGGAAACLVIEKGVFYEVSHPRTRQKLTLEDATATPAAAKGLP